jgi:hypothetical protein
VNAVLAFEAWGANKKAKSHVEMLTSGKIKKYFKNIVDGLPISV